MKAIKLIGSVVLLLLFGVASPTYSRQQDDKKQQDKNKQQPPPPPPQKQQQQAPPPKQQAPPPQPKQQQAPPQRQQEQPKQQPPPQQQRQQQGQQQQASPSRQQEQQRQQQQQPRQQQQQQLQQQQQQQSSQQQQQFNRNNQQGRQSSGGSFQGAIRANDGNPQHREQVRTYFTQDRARSWTTEHRDWRQRGGYRGYRVPDDRFRLYFGRSHFFRLGGLQLIFTAGRPRFYYDGYWVTILDPLPEYWSPDWFETDDIFIDYDGYGYYMYDRNYPGVAIAVEISM